VENPRYLHFQYLGHSLTTFTVVPVKTAIVSHKYDRKTTNLN
jgi:hypothetical protein